jgi:hypothetical protein
VIRISSHGMKIVASFSMESCRCEGGRVFNLLEGDQENSINSSEIPQKRHGEYYKV